MLSCGGVYYALQGGSTFASVEEILKCDHLNETELLSYNFRVAVYYALQGGSTFESVEGILKCDLK